MNASHIEKAYGLAKAAYAEWGVDTDEALKKLAGIPISLHCWQGDDVSGFEHSGNIADGGIMTTGNYPGKARNADELRQDLEKTFDLAPGRHRVNLHAIYAETDGKKVERNNLEFKHFKRWTDWARSLKIGLDFNPSCFAHPLASTGFTLSSADPAVRRFWVEHCTACRDISEAIGKALGTPCVHNIWIPDGMKDTPVDRKAPRDYLEQSLDRVMARKTNPAHVLDAVEGKLFGLGSESYVVGSHDFYLGYAAKNGILLCLDAGHFHPTETIVDKISATMAHLRGLLLHVSRGIRWDSDHVVVLSDDLRATAEEVVRGGFLDRVHIGLDYFDASINRVGAWTVGLRAMLKALLIAFLEPTDMLRKLELKGDYTGRLALLDELKTLPSDAIWNHYCLKQDAPVGRAWLDELRAYEKAVQFKRQ